MEGVLARIVNVRSASYSLVHAARTQLRKDDVIMQVNGHEVDNFGHIFIWGRRLPLYEIGRIRRGMMARL